MDSKKPQGFFLRSTINTPNVNTINANRKDDMVTVRDIESVTGYRLLSNLPQNIQEVVDKVKDPVN